MNKPQILRGVGIILDRDTLDIQLLSHDADTVMLRVVPMAIPENMEWQYAAQLRSLMVHASTRNYSYVMDDAEGTLYFNYRQCREDPEQTFRSFNKELFEVIKSRKPRKLVLDLRSNGGAIHPYWTHSSNRSDEVI